MVETRALSESEQLSNLKNELRIIKDAIKFEDEENFPNPTLVQKIDNAIENIGHLTDIFPLNIIINSILRPLKDCASPEGKNINRFEDYRIALNNIVDILLNLDDIQINKNAADSTSTLTVAGFSKLLGTLMRSRVNPNFTVDEEELEEMRQASEKFLHEEDINLRPELKLVKLAESVITPGSEKQRIETESPKTDSEDSDLMDYEKILQQVTFLEAELPDIIEDISQELKNEIPENLSDDITSAVKFFLIYLGKISKDIEDHLPSFKQESENIKNDKNPDSINDKINSHFYQFLKTIFPLKLSMLGQLLNSLENPHEESQIDKHNPETIQTRAAMRSAINELGNNLSKIGIIKHDCQTGDRFDVKLHQAEPQKSNKVEKDHIISIEGNPFAWTYKVGSISSELCKAKEVIVAK